jgi:hypothetical protein
MDFIKHIRVSQKCAKAGLGAEIDCPAAVFDVRKISGVSIAKDPPAEVDQTWLFLLFRRI